jgi:hypothetical protein
VAAVKFAQLKLLLPVQLLILQQYVRSVALWLCLYGSALFE